MKQIASLVFLLFFICITAEAQYGRVPRQFTDKLPRVDKVEMQKLKPAGYGFSGVLESKTIEGDEAQRIATLWRGQGFHRMPAVCHNPVFGIKFFSRGKTVMHASVCWDCNNILILEPKLKNNSIQGFDGDGKMGQKLLAEFKRLFP